MIFIYRYWENFCRQLHESGIHSICAETLLKIHPAHPYVILKHDVETNVKKAFEIAKIEHKWGHRGSYYVQAYLLKDPKNISLLSLMQEMGHEISYHYDVMDANAGNLQSAILDFKSNCELFEKNGFSLSTLCQHGNPVIERNGYASNRDFFRNESVKKQFPNLTDIMVDFKQMAYETTEYLYFSDAGRQFKLIYDPINNDLIPSDDKNVPFDTLNELWNYVTEQKSNCIISIHPHRWTSSRGKYIIKTAFFKTVRAIAKLLIKIPFMKKLMSKYYYLAKKI